MCIRDRHKYPPSSDFKQDDSVGISGTKTFETVISPNERKDMIPPLLFAYFDPQKEQYVTVKSEPIPVQVKGGAPAAAPAATAPVAAPAASPAAAPLASPKQQDILHQLTQITAAPQSFQPVYTQRSFWLAQVVPLLALLIYFVWKMR